MDVVSECKAGSGEKNGTRFSACLLFSANALARAITAIGDEEFGRVGLSYSHAYLLSEVINQPGITPSALSDTLYLTPSTITRLVEKLEQKQLVRRESEGIKTLICQPPRVKHCRLISTTPGTGSDSDTQRLSVRQMFVS